MTKKDLLDRATMTKKKICDPSDLLNNFFAPTVNIFVLFLIVAFNINKIIK